MFLLPKKRSNAKLIAAGIIVLVILGGVIYLVLFGSNLIQVLNPTLPVPIVSLSRNWAGYVCASNIVSPKISVTSVGASWTVPSVQSSSTDVYSSVWVGIGGQFDTSLIQTGTEQDFTNGSAKYYAWYEMLPSNQVPINAIQVSPGDQIRASILQAGTNSWSISIEDLTSNTRFQNTFTYNSQQLSAEWIVERPQVNGAIAQLANFGTVTFSNCQAILSGKTGGINSFPNSDSVLDPEVVNGRSVQLVTVSGVSSDGAQFSVKYTAI